MPLITRISKTPKMAFVLDEQRFRQLVKLIAEKVGTEELQYTVRLSDNSSVTCDSADEVLNIPNSRDRRITAIWMDSPYRSNPRIEIKFNAAFFMDPVEYTLQGDDEKNVFYASSRLDEFLSGLRQWYTAIIQPGVGAFILFQLLVMPVIYFTLTWLEGVLGIPQDERALAAGVLLWFVGGTAISGVMLLCYIALRMWLYPNGIFAMGDGLNRYRNMLGARRQVGSGIVLALLVSLAASWIYAQWS